MRGELGTILSTGQSSVQGCTLVTSGRRHQKVGVENGGRDLD
jgi:hypothetical protein